MSNWIVEESETNRSYVFFILTAAKWKRSFHFHFNWLALSYWMQFIMFIPSLSARCFHRGKYHADKDIQTEATSIIEFSRISMIVILMQFNLCIARFTVSIYIFSVFALEMCTIEYGMHNCISYLRLSTPNNFSSQEKPSSISTIIHQRAKNSKKLMTNFVTKKNLPLSSLQREYMAVPYDFPKLSKTL